MLVKGVESDQKRQCPKLLEDSCDSSTVDELADVGSDEEHYNAEYVRRDRKQVSLSGGEP